MPEQPLLIAFQKSFSWFKIKQKVSIPRFLRCLIKSQLKKLKHLSISMITNTKHFPHLEEVKFIAILQKSSVYKNTSRTPCLKQTNGSSPVKNKKNIFKTQPAEQKLTVFGFLYLNSSFKDPAHPHTVMLYLLYFLIILSNSMIPSRLLYFSQMFMGFQGNFWKSSSNSGILFLSVDMLGPPKVLNYFWNVGKSQQLHSEIYISTPHVLIRFES